MSAATERAPADTRPTIAVVKLASCDGCQLQLLDAEDALLELAGAVRIVNFVEASSRIEPGPYDVTLVEGSVSAPEQEEQVRELRRRSGVLVTIGACAATGGIQALRNAAGSLDRFVRTVYPTPAYIESLARSRPVSDYVPVDLELTGCPVDRAQLLASIASLLHGARPRISTSPVCLECKRRGNVCVLVARGEACLGPVTRTGCGALCPAFGRGCFGCFGPADDSINVPALVRRLRDDGLSRKQVLDRLRFISGWAPAFRAAADALEHEGAEP